MSALSSALHNTGHYHVRPRPVCLPPSGDAGGLQVRRPSGQWTDVPVVDGCLIVNIGDLMARWTNDRWRAPLHQVANPPPKPSGGSSGRLSHIFFQSPHDRTLVECLDVCCGEGHPAKYAPVLAGEYLQIKFKRVRSVDHA